MWKLGVLFLLGTCSFIQVKATSDINLEDLLERLVVLEDWKRVTENEVASLKSTVARQEITIQNLQRDLAAQSNLTAELLQHCQQDKRQDASHDEETASDGTQTSADRVITTELHSKVNYGVSKMKKREIAGGVAFTAYLDHDVNPGPKQVIKFNQVVTNAGNGYNTVTGIFTCQEAGLYLFSFFVGQRSTNEHTNQLNAELVVNGHIAVGAIVETRHALEDAQGGNTAVVRLNQGDTVWVDALGSGFHVEGGNNLRTSTFTGLYLYA